MATGRLKRKNYAERRGRRKGNDGRKDFRGEKRRLAANPRVRETLINEKSSDRERPDGNLSRESRESSERREKNRKVRVCSSLSDRLFIVYFINAEVRRRPDELTRIETKRKKAPI